MSGLDPIPTWADRIRPHLLAAVEHIVTAGRELIAAKAALPHGAFGPLLASLDLTPRTAQKFMAIAAHPTLANTTHGSHLPATWTTLFELSRVEPDVLDAAIAAGQVDASTTRAEAKELADRPQLTYEEARRLSDRLKDSLAARGRWNDSLRALSLKIPDESRKRVEDFLNFDLACILPMFKAAGDPVTTAEITGIYKQLRQAAIDSLDAAEAHLAATGDTTGYSE